MGYSLEDSLNLNPYEKVKYLLKLNAKFLIENIGISRVSIVADLLNGRPDDNSIQTINAYYRLLKKLYGERKNDQELKALVYIAISTLQVTFLRRDVLKETENVDFMNETQRDELFDVIIDRIFYDLKEMHS